LGYHFSNAQNLIQVGTLKTFLLIELFACPRCAHEQLASGQRRNGASTRNQGLEFFHLDGPTRFRNTRRSRHPSKEAELLRAVAHQHVFSLLIVIKHHLVSLPADARLLVAAKRRVVAGDAANGAPILPSRKARAFSIF
jgi:hypothetical protein